MASAIQEAYTAVATGDSERLATLLAAADEPFALVQAPDDAPAAGLDGGLDDPKLDVPGAAAAEDGFTMLHLAALRGHALCVEVLLSAKAPTGAATASSGSTPLHCAALHGHKAVVELLLEGVSGGSGGADPRARDADGHTPLCLARLFKHTTVARLLKVWCAEQLCLAPPPPPIYVALVPGSTSGAAAACCRVSPGLWVVVAARNSERTLTVCTPAQIAPCFRPRLDRTCGDEAELPILWLKITVETAAPARATARAVATSAAMRGSSATGAAVVAAAASAPRMVVCRPKDLPVTVQDLEPGEA